MAKRASMKKSADLQTFMRSDFLRMADLQSSVPWEHTSVRRAISDMQAGGIPRNVQKLLGERQETLAQLYKTEAEVALVKSRLAAIDARLLALSGRGKR